MMPGIVVHPQEAAVSVVRLPVALCVTLTSLAPLTVGAQPDAAAIEQAVRQLGDQRFAVREQASKRLWEAGAAAEPALRRVLQGDDAEAVRRARELLDKFDWGIYPDTLPAVLKQIEAYRGGNDDTRPPAIHELARLGKPGYAALKKLAEHADTPEDRKLFGGALTEAVARVVPPMLLDHDDASAEALLETSLVGEAEGAAANYAAFLLLRGKLDPAITRWEAEAKTHPSTRTAEVLVALYRAKGDYAPARKHAAGRDELLEAVLWEQGDWAELARHVARDRRQVRERDATASPALRAAYYRLAGDTPAADAALAALRKTEGAEWAVAEGLLFNERPADALDILTRRPESRATVLGLLTVQLRYRDALALVDKSAGGDGRPDPVLTIQQARVLHALGERDRVGQLFAKLASGFGTAADSYEVEELVQTEMFLGLKDAAREHAAGFLAILAKQAVDGRFDLCQPVLEAAFPKNGEAARVWWTFLRQKFPQENEPAAMKRLRDLLDPPVGAAGPGALADALLDSQPDGKPAAVRARLALAAAYEAAGQIDAAQSHLAAAAERSGAAADWLKLGDFLRGRKQFAAAAVAYEKAWKDDKARPLPLYLYGWSLIQAGRAAEGKALMDQAHILLLGNANERGNLAEELSQRDLPELARREREFVLRLGWARSWPAGNLLSYVAREAVARQDFARAADAYERIITGVLDSEGVGFREPSAYLVFPALARTYRARAALAAGRTDEAMAHARACLDVMPGNIDLALLLIPELDRRGHTAYADALYARIVAPHDSLCQEFGQSGRFHNDRAWLAAGCHRDLDAALDHARKATEIEPHNASYRDTLAEVYFQRGDTAKAIELMRECMKAEPRRVYFTKQMRRFEAGDRSVPPPSDDDA
jgi:Tfp pilus assembly protein PilF